MRKTSLLFFACLALLGACKSSGTQKSSSASTSSVIQTIGDRPIYSSEFAYVYKKNNANAEDIYSEHSVREYLRLYTNFKLKVRAAEDAGLDTLLSFINELEGYKKQLAQPYFTEKSLTDKFALEAYDRLKEEINASHILIMVKENAEPKDTLEAWNKAEDVRQKALKGEDFAKLAQMYSEDPSAKSNAGNLGYFSALQMVFPFEDAAYNLKKGEVSNPIRTRFGYHIIKLHDRRPSQGEIQVAHLMVRATAGMPEEDSVAARNKAFELHKRLLNGEDWESLVNQFSDDINSRSKGGELPWFSTGKMIPSFEEAAFKLNKKGELSEPVLSPYGWHIIKFLDRKELPSYKELEARIKQKVSKDRADYYRVATIERLKKENRFKEKVKNLQIALSFADSSLLKGKWNGEAGKKGSVELFSIGGEKFTIGDFFSYIRDNQKPGKEASPDFIMSGLYKDFVDQSNIKYEEAHLEEKYVDYRMLVNEYRDGILLFQLMDEKVWTKAIKDTAGLREYFNNSREKYKWDARAHAVIFNVNSEATLKELKSELKKEIFPVNKDYPTISFDFGKALITDKEKSSLNRIVRELAKNKDLVVEVKGIADIKEAKGANANISLKRAEAVKEYLNEKGISSEQILVKDGGKGNNSFVATALFTKNEKELEKVFNQDAPLSLQVTKGVFQKKDNEILSKVDWKTGEQELKQDDRVFYVVISKIDEPRLKTFEESRGLIISDYQVQLEEEWLTELRQKYPVDVNEDEVLKIIKK